MQLSLPTCWLLCGAGWAIKASPESAPGNLTLSSSLDKRRKDFIKRQLPTAHSVEMLTQIKLLKNQLHVLENFLPLFNIIELILQKRKKKVASQQILIIIVPEE